MKELQRTKVGEFKIENSITLEQIIKNPDIIQEKIISIEKIFEKLPMIELENSKIVHFLNGVRITNNKPDGVYKIYNNGEFIGTGIIKENLLKRDIILNILCTFLGLSVS